MTTPNIETVIDKLAQKIGVAADKLQPLGEEVVRQVAERGRLHACAGAFLLVLGVCCALRGLCFLGRVLPGKLDEREVCISIAGMVSLGILSFLLAGVGQHYLSMGLEAWIAPLPTILGL